MGQRHGDESEFPDEKDVKAPATKRAAPPDADETGEELPPVTSILLDCKDSRGIHYQGTFVFKVPNMRDTMEIGRRKSILLPVSVVNDANAIMLAEMIAYLDVTLQRGKGNERLPDWWKPMEFYDETPIVALYAEVTAYARKFRGEARPDSRGASGETSEGTAADGGGDVDGNVQAPVERRTIHESHSARSSSAGSSRRSAAGGEG